VQLACPRGGEMHGKGSSVSPLGEKKPTVSPLRRKAGHGMKTEVSLFSSGKRQNREVNDEEPIPLPTTLPEGTKGGKGVKGNFPGKEGPPFLALRGSLLNHKREIRLSLGSNSTGGKKGESDFYQRAANAFQESLLLEWQKKRKKES